MAEPRTPRENLDDESAALDDIDHQRLARVDRSLIRARLLRDWWEGKHCKWMNVYDGRKLSEIVKPGSTYRDAFVLTRALPIWPETEANFGFLDQAKIDGEDREIMGLFQQTLFDEPRTYFAPSGRNGEREAFLQQWQHDLRAFVQKYLIRMTGFYETAPYADPSRRPVADWLQPFSWLPPNEERRGGFGFRQLYYKKRGDKICIGKFRDVDHHRVDLQSLETTYEWIVVGIRIHDLHLRHPSINWINLSIDEEVLAVLSKDFNVFDDRPDGLRGRYGFGYAVLEDPPKGDAALVWHRPTFGFQQNQFIILETGRVLARVVMVTEKLSKLLAINPVEWARVAADRATLGLFTPAAGAMRRMIEAGTPGAVRAVAEMTGGVPDARFDPIAPFVALMSAVPFNAAEDLGITRDGMLRSLLSDFVRSQLSTIIASRGVWRAVTNWANEADVPDWVPKA